MISHVESFLGEDVLGLLGGGFGSLRLVLVKFHELGKIELGLLKNLNLLDENVLEREDLGTLLCDLFANRLGNPIHFIININEANKKTSKTLDARKKDA